MTTSSIVLTELERPEMERALAETGVPAFHGRQIFRWIYQRNVTDVAQMTDLSRALRTDLAGRVKTITPEVVSTQVSSDGTTKFLLRLADGREIEAVYIPDTPAQTFCISTQVGCAMGCTFCLTGKMGLTRNLTAGEIAGQVRVLAHTTGLATSAFNVVLMGMGEPLHNYDETMKALRMLGDEHGLAVHSKRVTLSTVGLIPALERLAKEPVVPNLAISLHATTTAGRSEIVPINRKYELEQLIAVCRRFPLGARRRITFEYVLLAGVNDTADDARRLAKLLQGLKAKVNLLPLNEAPGIPYRRPTDTAVNAFARILAERDILATVRKSRGRDIRAACGQLIVEGSRRPTGRALAERMGAE